MNNEVIERYKKYLTNAQVKELAAKAERYKLLNAQSRAAARNSILTQQRQARRGLQNVGLAGREGKVISGMETARNDALANAYDAYNRQLRKVEEAQAESEAVRMANATIAARQRAQQEALLAQQQAQAEAAAAQRQQNMLTRQVRDKNQWNQQMTDTGDAPRKQPTQYEQAVSYALQNGATKKDAVEFATQYEQQQKAYEQAKLNASTVKNWQQTMTGKEWDQEQTTPLPPVLYKQYNEKLPEWERLIASEPQGEISPRDSVAKGNKKKAEQARREMAQAQAKIARYSILPNLPADVGELVVLTDDDFDVRFDAAEKVYNRAMQEAKIARQDNPYTMDDLNPNGIERKATEEFAKWIQAKKIRSAYSETAYYYDTFKTVDAAKKYDSDAKEGDYTVDVKAYDREHGTEDSKYAAIVNQLSKVLTYTDRAYRYTFRGKADNNPKYQNFEERIYNDRAYDIAPDERSIAGKHEKLRAVMVAASYMTDDERARYNSILYQDGADTADKYFEYLYETVLIDRVSQAIDEDYDATLRRTTKYDEYGNRIGAENGKLTWLGQVGTSVLSVPMNILEGATEPINSLMQGQSDPVAARLSAVQGSSAQGMRNAVQENFGKVGSFLYQTGMSMADSAAVAVISGGIGNALQGLGVAANVAGKIGSVLGGSILGGSAFNSSYEEALQRGLSPDKARATALGNGVNEMLFEALSLDMLVGHYQKGGMLKVSKNRWVNLFVNTMVQGGVEGSEEFFTDMANNLWDKKVNGIYAEELTKLREYISQGMSYADAKRKVNAEFAGQLGMSFLGGFVSGGVMGGGATFMGMLQGQDVAKIGRNLDDAAKAEIRAHDFQNAEAKEILTGKLTDEDYGRLAMTRLEEMAQTDPVAADKAAQSLIDAMARTDVKVDKRNQTLKTGTDNSVSFDYDGVTDVKKMSGVQVEALRFAQTLVKSKVGGVNINVANKLFDQNGNEQNGWYDAKTNTVHVSLNGSQSVVYTISHELTHRLKEGNAEAFNSLRDAMKSELENMDLTGSDLPSDYSDILGDYLVKDGVQRTAWEALIDYEMDRYAKHKINLDRESAEEEVVCRACETMLERSRLISSMISKNVRSAKTIAKFLASIYDDIASLKEEAESRGYVDGSPEKLFIDQYTDVEKIANAWANAMKTVSQDETKKIVKEEGRGGTAFSLKQELRDDGQSLADKSMKYRKAHKAESQHISDEMLEAANKQIHRMAQRMLPFLTLKNKKGMTYLPDEVLGKTRFGNSSYGGTSIENTTICFRTLAYIDFTNEIKKQIGRPLTVEESFLASQMLYQIAKEPQCLYCYVSLDRKAYDEQLLSYIKQRDKVVEGYNKLSLDERQAITKATRNPSKVFEGDVPLYTEFLAGRKNTEQMRTRFAQWIDIANSGSEAITAADLATDERRGLMRNGDDWQENKRTAGKVSLQDQVIDAERYAQSASWAKKMEEYRAYNGDILKIGKRTVTKLNNEYGLRFYSFSEYSPAFIVENMQQIRDAALKGLMGLAYTKKTDFARIFAGTGMNINVSTFGRWGVDADGNRVVVMDSDQGADWTEVQNLRKQYENVGAVFVATDDAMTEWAIKQDWIDVVIPFHIVRTGANVAEFYKWVIHNKEQNDVTAEGKNATIPAAEHGNSYEKYMSLVNERGLTPRFDKWRPENNPNVTADEYMKLVNETRRTLDETNPLQPIYDTREAARSFGAFVHDGGYYGDYYKAKSEQDIKVPVTPEQDILGIGSKTYTEQEGIDRVVADIKAGNKANQVPYGRQDIDEQISRLNKARQVKQHGQKFSIKESDREYMSLASKVKDGTATDADKAELRKQVDAAAKANGYVPVARFHQTKEAFNRFSTDNPVAGLHDSETPNGIFLKTNDHDIGIGGSIQMPLYLASGNYLHFLNRKEANAWYCKNVQGYESLQNEMESKLKEFEDRIAELEKQEFDPSKTDEEVNKLFEEEQRIIDEMRPVENEYRMRLRELLNQYFLHGKHHYDGIELDYDGHRWVNGKRENVHTYIAFKANQLKSADLVTYDKDGNIIPLSERFKTDRTGEDAWKNEDIRFSLKEGEERAIKIADGKTKNGETVSFIDRILDGEKTGETRTTRASIKPNAWVGIYKDGKVYGRVKFGDPMWITKQSKEYKTSYIKDTNYDIDDSVGGKWYYPVLEVQDFRDNPIQTNRAGQWGAAYELPQNAKYSIKDESPDKLGGKEYLKYLQLGTKVVNQTATDAEIKEFKQRMVQLSEDNRMAFLDKLREKLIRADEAAKVREVRDRQIARLKEEFKESKEKARERRIRSDLTNTLKKGNDRIVKLLANPTENSHVPVQLAQAVAEYAQRLNELLTTSVPKTGEFAGMEKQTQKGALNAQKILDALKRSYADAETIEMLKAEDPKFDPRGLIPVQYDENGKMIKDDSLAEMVRGMDEIIQGKHLNELTTDELRYVMNTMRGVIYAVTEANKVTVDGESRNVYRTSRKMANEVKSASKVFGDKSNAITKFLNRYVIESLGLRRIAKLYSGSDENATFVKLVDDLNEGAIEQERIKQTLRNMFNDVTSKYEKDMKTWYGKNAEWIDTGFGFKITKGMRVSLAMHILNEQNLRNVEKAGLRIPEQSAYRKGNYKEAYKNGKVYRLTKAQAEQIVANMTEAEKAYFEVAKEFFHKVSGKYINRTSLKLLGFSKAIVDNYFPIQTDDAYRTVKYDDVHQNASVEHPGFLESRKGTANVMYLNDINAVVNRQIDGVAKYAGLAIPMRNWNNVMNAWLFEENENGEWVRSDEGRPHDVLERRMGYTNGKGKAIMDYVDQFITDLSSGGVSNANDDVQAGEFAAKLTSNYVKAVLTLNARVALSQLASVPTAAAEIPWKYIVQGFGGNVEGHLNRNASNELIDMYTPIFAMRRAGTQTEVSEVMKRKGFADRAEQKLPGLLGWITAMDTAATRRLWYACERWVKGETNIPVGSDAFYQEVAKRYERVIQNTQPNFTVLQRSPALRSKNAAARIITMFGTQRMQNGGILIESAAEVAQAKDAATRKAALKKFGRALSGQITAAIVLGISRAIVAALRGRMKPLQDEDKEITAKSVDKYIRGEVATSLAGSFMYVGEIYDFVHGFVSGITEGDSGYDQSFALPAAEALSTLIGFFRDKDWQYFAYMNAKDEHGNPKHTDHEKWLKTKSFINELMTVASYATGLPLANLSKTILNGLHPAGHDIADAIKTGELIPWLRQSGRIDSKKTNANYNEWTNVGKKGSTYLYWDNKMKGIDGGREARIAELLNADDLTNEEKAMLVRMFDTSGAKSEGTKVFNKNDELIIDFAHPEEWKPKTAATIDIPEEVRSTNGADELTDHKLEGVTEATEQGVPAQEATDAFVVYQNIGNVAGRDDEFREWLFANVDDPNQRAVLEYQVIGRAAKVEGAVTYKDNGTVYRDYTDANWYKLSNRKASSDGTNKRYEAAKKLEQTGLTVDKTVAIYNKLDTLSKKAEWTEYMKAQGLTDEQIHLFLWSRGWAKLN